MQLNRTHSYLLLTTVFFLVINQLAADINTEQTSNKQTSAIVVHGAALPNNLQQTAGSVSVLTHDQLQQDGNEHIQQQFSALPNVNYVGGTNRPKFLNIRGIGELEQYEGAPNSRVAVIVDEVDLSGSSAALGLFDIGQLEIHRGPQATRFGSSALAGAINLSTTKPSNNSDNFSQVSIGNDQLMSGGLALGTNLTDQLDWRLSTFGHYQNGFRDNDYLNSEDSNKRQEFNGRSSWLFTPTKHTNLTFTLWNVALNNGYDAFSIFNDFNTQSDRPGRDQEKLKLASFKAEIGQESHQQITSITSIHQIVNKYSFDGDWGNNAFWSPYTPYDYFSANDRERTVFAQQFRLSSSFSLFNNELRSMLGAYFHTLKEQTEINEYANDEVYDSLESEYNADTYALFGSLEIPLPEKLKFINGLRLEQRNSSYSDTNQSSFSPNDFMWGGNSTLQYDFNQEHSTYFTIARGFLGGGFNSSPSINSERKEFSPETLWNFELGHKFALFNQKLTGSLSSFVSLRRDQQIKVAEQDDPGDPLSYTYLTDNAARGNSQGLELELDYLLSERLKIRSANGLLRTKISAADNSLANLEGRDQAHAPRWQYLLEKNYKLTDRLTSIVGLSGLAAFYYDDSHSERSKAYHLLHAGLKYDHNNWSLLLWGRNLTDEKYAVRGFYFGNEPPDFPNKTYIQLGNPRTFGLTLNYYF